MPARQLSQAGADAQQNAQTTLDGLETRLESVKGKVENAVGESGASEEERGAVNEPATVSVHERGQSIAQEETADCERQQDQRGSYPTGEPAAITPPAAPRHGPGARRMRPFATRHPPRR